MVESNNTYRPTVCAIVCIRNEVHYLPALLSHLGREGLDIAVIDNGSTDGSREFLESKLGQGILFVKDLPYKGSFSLRDQLEAKAEVIASIDHDWVLHSDADEIIHSTSSNVSLVDVARAAQDGGYNVINFEEFVFIPKPGQDAIQLGDQREILRYYYFAPIPTRLMRMWKRDSDLDNRSGAGHSLEGNKGIFPETQILRHYITLNQSHINNKYIGRVFDNAELSRGWHRNRIGLTENDLSFARIPATHGSELSCPKDRNFDRSKPRKSHYWSWKHTPLIEAEMQVVETGRRAAFLKADLISMNTRLSHQSRLFKKAKMERDQAMWENEMLRKSLSWRLTRPLRKLAQTIRSRK